MARERQAEATAALRAGAPVDSPAWSIHGSLLADSGRLLREIDPDGGPHTDALPARSSGSLR